LVPRERQAYTTRIRRGGLEEAETRKKMKGRGRLKRFLVAAGIAVGVAFLVAYVLRKFVQLVFPRGVDVAGLYLPRTRRRRGRY